MARRRAPAIATPAMAGWMGASCGVGVCSSPGVTSPLLYANTSGMLSTPSIDLGKLVNTTRFAGMLLGSMKRSGGGIAWRDW